MASTTPTPAALLAAYDAQLREDGELARSSAVERHGPLLWARFGRRGFVTYRSLGAAAGAGLDELIAATIAHYRDDTDVPSFEWKTRGHDAPADLGARLAAHGFVPEEVETVMVGEAAALAAHPVSVPGVTVRRAGDGADLRADLAAMLAAQESVFGGGRGPDVEDALAEAAGDESEFWLAEEDGAVVCAGRLTPVPGTAFAGLWGGATLPAARGRGIYRALVAARAGAALERGIRYLHSDCTAMSRPILERAGLVAITTSTPYIWSR